jgi:hypothetical protein
MRRRKGELEPTAQPAEDAATVYGPTCAETGRTAEGRQRIPPRRPEGWRPREFEDVETPDDGPVPDLVDIIGKG